MNKIKKFKHLWLISKKIRHFSTLLKKNPEPSEQQLHGRKQRVVIFLSKSNLGWIFNILFIVDFFAINSYFLNFGLENIFNSKNECKHSRMMCKPY